MPSLPAACYSSLRTESSIGSRAPPRAHVPPRLAVYSPHPHVAPKWERLASGPHATTASPRMSVRAEAAAAAAAMAATPAITSSSFLPAAAVDLILKAVTLYHLTAFALVLALGSTQPVRSTVRTLGLWGLLLPLALVYGVLLVNSWSPDTLSIMMPGSLQEGLSGFKPQFFPQLSGIASLFQRPATAASWLVHGSFINLFLGRQIYLDGKFK